MSGIIKQRSLEGAGAGGGVRTALKMLQGEVNRGAELTEERAEANWRFAVSVLDDPRCTTRDKLRATELLEAMRSRGIAVAMHLDKMERPAATTKVDVEHRHYVKVIKGVDPEAL